jgi:ABC-type sugar transport system ATPase subunit
VSFEVWPGEILALVGDNGAGKSTLTKILAGVYDAGAGTLYVNDRPVTFRSAADAVRAGISTVYQDLALVDTRDVAANLFLGREFTRGPFVDRRRGEAEAAAVLKTLRLPLPSVRTLVAQLSGGQRQAVAVARAFAQGGQVIILDEPTAALGVAESDRVLQLAADLRAAGKAVILISHNLQQIWSIADRFMVLHLGSVAGIHRKDDVTVDQIVRLIVYGSLNADNGNGPSPAGRA